MRKRLEECEKKKDEYLTYAQRGRADFLNYKKEEMERVRELIILAQGEIIFKILPILDSFELAEKNLSEELKNNVQAQGILQIKKQLYEFLKKYGLEEMKTMGEKFDPNFHEAVEQIETKDKESGTIIEEIQKGYTLQGKVIRVAKVRVAK